MIILTRYITDNRRSSMRLLFIITTFSLCMIACASTRQRPSGQDHQTDLTMGDTDSKSIKTKHQNDSSNQKIRKIIDDQKSIFKACFETQRTIQPDLEGSVTTQLIISRSGRILSVKITNSSMNNTNVKECVLHHMKRLQFPKLNGGNAITITYPLYFNRN